MTARSAWVHEVHTTIDPIRDEWEQLAATAEAAPFLRLGWLEAWWRAFGRGTLSLVAVRAGGELRALLPAARQGPFLTGLSNPHTPWFGPLADGPEAAHQLATAVARLRPWRVGLANLPGDDLVARAFLGWFEGRGWRPLNRVERSLIVPTGGSWTDYVSSLSKSRVASVRRNLRRLGDVGPVHLELTVGPRDPRGLDDLLAAGMTLEATGWKGARGTAMRSQPGVAQFYGEMARWAAARDMLAIAQLFVGERLVAWSMGVEANRRHYALKMGVDPAFATYGPGILMVYLLLERCFQRDIDCLEMLGWDEPWKRTLAREYRPRRHTVLYAPGLLGWAGWTSAATARRGFRLAAAAYRRARSLRDQT